MLNYCREHWKWEDFKELLPRLDAVEMANMAICLCHQVDSALEKYLERKDREFTTQGGIRERMTAARLDQRASQRAIIDRQQQEIEALKREIARLKSLLNKSQLENLD